MIRKLVIYQIILCFITIGCSQQEAVKLKIVSLQGHQLYLDDDRRVDLLGAYVPQPKDVNYSSEVSKEIQRLLLGKEVLVINVVRKTDRYPRRDKVKVILDGKTINEYLLKEGLAFYFEDFWDKQEQIKYRKLESNARELKKGIWKKPGDLIVLSTRHKDWQFTKFPGCEGYIPDGKRINYYYPLLDVPLDGVMEDFYDDCSMTERLKKIPPELIHYYESEFRGSTWGKLSEESERIISKKKKLLKNR